MNSDLFCCVHSPFLDEFARSGFHEQTQQLLVLCSCCKRRMNALDHDALAR